MNNSVDRVFAAIIVTFFALLLGACGWLDNSLDAIKQEAVKRGYAEWYAVKEGKQPTQWRWKEASGDE